MVQLQERATISNTGNIPNHAQDYHFTAQVTLGEYMRPMDILCPISNIICEGEGADKMTARNQIKGGTTGRISRACHCTPDDADKAQLICVKLSKDDIVRDFYQLVQNNPHEASERKQRRDEFVATHQVHPVETPSGLLILALSKTDPTRP